MTSKEELQKQIQELRNSLKYNQDQSSRSSTLFKIQQLNKKLNTIENKKVEVPQTQPIKKEEPKKNNDDINRGKVVESNNILDSKTEEKKEEKQNNNNNKK